MKLGVFTPVFGTMQLDEVLHKVRSLQHVTALEIGTGGWPGSAHLNIDALLDKKPCGAEYRKKIADAGLTISAEHDYRVLRPRTVTDANGNRRAVTFSPLALVTATAVMGKDGEQAGDTLEAPRAGWRTTFLPS